MAPEAKLFATTRWTMVIQAAGDESGEARQALDQLCRTYWKPLYVYLRRSGFSAPDAEDLTQGFLARLLARQGLRRVAPGKGKFRSFLLASLKNHLANEWSKARTYKRGQGEVPLALSNPEVERSYQIEAAGYLTPDRLYDRQWAYTVLKLARQRLRREYMLEAKASRFKHLVGFLPGEPQRMSQSAAASLLGMSEGAFRVEVHRFRHRFGELLRAEVAQTVLHPEDVDDELRHLIEIVSE